MFFIRPLVSLGRIYIAYVQRKNFKKRESHLLKSEKRNPAYHAKSLKRPGFELNYYHLCDNHSGIPVFKISLWYPSKVSILAFRIPLISPYFGCFPSLSIPIVWPPALKSLALCGAKTLILPWSFYNQWNRLYKFTSLWCPCYFSSLGYP